MITPSLFSSTPKTLLLIYLFITLLSSSTPLTYLSPMETLQLSNDSFSYSWLINPKPSFFDLSGLDDSLRFSIEVDPRVAACQMESPSFHFCPPSADPSAMAYADQVFDDGRLLPLHLMITTPPRAEPFAGSADDRMPVRSGLSADSTDSLLSANKSVRYGAAPGALSSSSSSKSASPSPSGGGDKLPLQPPLFGDCAKRSKRLIDKYLSFLVPWCEKVTGLGMMRRRRRRRRRRRSCMEHATWTSSVPRGSDDALASFDWPIGGDRARDLGRENAIKDAILHCKNSIKR